jgi:hypothetical protein
MNTPWLDISASHDVVREGCKKIKTRVKLLRESYELSCLALFLQEADYAAIELSALPRLFASETGALPVILLLLVD